MAYPTGILSVVLARLDLRAIEIKAQCQVARAESLVGNVNSSRLIGLFNFLRTQRAGLATDSATPGLAAYAQAQKNQPGLDVVAEFNAMLSTLDGVTAWIIANFPKDASGFLLERTWGADSPVDRSFTPAQMAGFRTALDSLIATIA